MKTINFKILFIFFTLLGFIGLESKAQFSATNSKTIKELVEELIGKDNMDKFQVTNIRYNGRNVDNNQTIQWGTGSFEKFGDEIEKGIVLSTMVINNLNQSPDSVSQICQAEQGNNSQPHHTTVDADLSQVSGSTSLFDGQVIEFDFVPKGKKMKFDYIFGSDEYPYYVCSQFNDAFGFFLSGPGITGSVNLAQLPNSNTPVTINNVNGGQSGTNFPPPCGNTITNTVTCNLNNATFFRDNLNNKYIPNMELNGYTLRLSAEYDELECNEKYSIKLAIADVADHRYNSGVFLESGSFTIDNDTVANIVQLDVPICGPFEITAKNGVEVPEEIWIWGDNSAPQTVKPGGKEVKHLYKEPGTYIIKLIGIDKESCIGRDTVEREITIEPEQTMEVSSTTKLPKKCDTFDEYEFEIALTTKNVKSSVWKLDGDEIARNVDKIKEKIEDEGEHEVTVKLTSDPCERDTTLKWKIKYVKPKTMEVSAGEPQEIACYPFEFEFWSKTKLADEIHWDFGDGKSSDEKNPKHQYKNLGDYKVTFTAKNDTLCDPEKTITFDVSLLRDKKFEPDFKIKAPEPCESSKFDLKVEAFYTGNATDRVKWDFDDNHKETLEGKDIYDTLEHVYTKEGLYTIRLKAYDDLCGLDSVTTREILFKRKPVFEDIFAPNVFTPNGDKINDYFTMFYGKNKDYNFYADVLQYEVDVFNRWGTKVFSSGMINLKDGEEVKHWDGSTPLISNGKPADRASEGVYFYMIRYKMECIDEKDDSQFRELIGNVHIFR